MIGLDYIMAGYIQLAAADISCKPRKTPLVTVQATDTNVRYDHSKSRGELEKFNSDTVSPYGKEVRTHVGGLMSGEVSISQSINFMQEIFPRFNSGCLYINNIKVRINIRPVIYISSEHSKTGCMYRAIMEHERKHVAVDQKIVGKYTRLIRERLVAEIRAMPAAYGPHMSGHMEAAQDRVQLHLQKIIRDYSSQMSRERLKLQQDVDTLEEYERVQAKCRGMR